MTITVALVSIVLPLVVSTHGGWLAMVLITLCGVPHGATDHLLFRHVHRDASAGWLYRFVARYFLLMGLLLVTWMILPSLAFMIFLAVSVYHFGQAQWHYIRMSSALRIVLYSLWGAFVLFSPLLWNYTETQPIIASLTGLDIYLSADFQFIIPILLAFLVVISTILLFILDKITIADLIWENFVVLVLTFLFSATPLLVGFATYFVCWHSFDSMQQQVQAFQVYRRDYTASTYFKEVIPFFLLALLSLLGFAYWTTAPLLSDAWVGQFFMLISVVTLPHSILMDAFLEGMKPSLETKQDAPTSARVIIVEQTG